MKNCIDCGEKTQVIESRLGPDGSIRRRRECPECGRRITTYETLQVPLRVAVEHQVARAADELERLGEMLKLRQATNANVVLMMECYRLAELLRKEFVAI